MRLYGLVRGVILKIPALVIAARIAHAKRPSTVHGVACKMGSPKVPGIQSYRRAFAVLDALFKDISPKGIRCRRSGHGKYSFMQDEQASVSPCGMDSAAAWPTIRSAGINWGSSAFKKVTA